MNTIALQYKIRKNVFMVSEGVVALPGILRDDPKNKSWEDFDEQSMGAYFGNNYGLFLERLRGFKNLDRRLTAMEEKELRFMLDALIAAKNFLGDKS